MCPTMGSTPKQPTAGYGDGYILLPLFFFFLEFKNFPENNEEEFHSLWGLMH